MANEQEIGYENKVVPSRMSYLNKIVRIEWVDSCAGGYWEMISDFKHGLCYCTTYGKVVADDNECYCVAGTFAENQYLAALTIPKCAVKRISIIDKEG